MSLIGWSLGGIYARELAKMHPTLARCVITLGTPFTGHPKATNAWRLYELLSRSKVGDESVMAQIRKPPPVPTTSIYSRSDGIVSWRCSINAPGPLVENIEVPASHVGMGMNPLALYAIADRLAQPIGAWQPFDVARRAPLFFRTGIPEPMRPRRLTAPRPMQLSANGIRLEVEDHGSPHGEPLLLVMGLGMQLLGWHEDFVALLVARGFRVIRFDNRDIGLSQSFDHRRRAQPRPRLLRHALGMRVKSPYTLDDMAEDAVGVLDALGIAARARRAARRWAG